MADELLRRGDLIGPARKQARAEVHPDRMQGRRDAWDAVETAAGVLAAHHGVAL